MKKKTKNKPSILDVLKLAQRELREFYTDKGSQALIEINEKINELESESLIHVLVLNDKNISKQLSCKLQDNGLYEYRDKYLSEHLYSCDKDNILNKAIDKGVKFSQKELKELDKLCFFSPDSAYFRIVNNF